MPTLRNAVRIVLGSALAITGATHLTVARAGFRDQVPGWVPFDADATVLVSGAVEIALGAALVALPAERRRIGVVIAAFLVAVFPGNLSQWRHRRDGLGFDTDAKRLARLPFQPLMIAAVLWATRD